MTTKKPRAKAPKPVEAWGFVIDGKLRPTSMPDRKSALLFLAFAEVKAKVVRVRIAPAAPRRTR